MEKRYKFRRRVIRNIILLAIFIVVIIIIINSFRTKKQEKTKTVAGNATNQVENIEVELNENSKSTSISDENSKEITTQKSHEAIEELGWNLTLVNSENKMPDRYEVELEDIDQYRKFDSRAIEYLNSMINDMKASGAINIWPQSTYRSVETQTELYNNKVQYFKNIGKSEEEAKALTEQVINKPGYSEHNLGLAVDFNYVKESFKDTKEYAWLKENAEDYGFILRYPKEKENITKVSYEPWHWRFVGIEHAKKINELGMCLEEYIEYLNQ